MREQDRVRENWPIFESAVEQLVTSFENYYTSQQKKTGDPTDFPKQIAFIATIYPVFEEQIASISKILTSTAELKRFPLAEKIHSRIGAKIQDPIARDLFADIFLIRYMKQKLNSTQGGTKPMPGAILRSVCSDVSVPFKNLKELKARDIFISFLIGQLSRQEK